MRFHCLHDHNDVNLPLCHTGVVAEEDESIELHCIDINILFTV